MQDNLKAHSIFYDSRILQADKKKVQSQFIRGSNFHICRIWLKRE